MFAGHAFSGSDNDRPCIFGNSLDKLFCIFRIVLPIGIDYDRPISHFRSCSEACKDGRALPLILFML